MIYTITLVISVLVAINFLLLAFSCNKTTKKVASQPKTLPYSPIKKETITKKSASIQLAPTGS